MFDEFQLIPAVRNACAARGFARASQLCLSWTLAGLVSAAIGVPLLKE